MRDPALLSVFKPLLRRKDELGEPLFEAASAFKGMAAATMEKLLAHLSGRRSLRFGAIVDETQKVGLISRSAIRSLSFVAP